MKLTNPERLILVMFPRYMKSWAFNMALIRS